MRISKEYPNAYLGLARLRMKQGREQESLEALEALFTDSAPTTIRSQPVLDEARGLYLDLNRTLTEASFDHLMEVVDARVSELEESSGIPIEIVEDSSLEGITAKRVEPEADLGQDLEDAYQQAFDALRFLEHLQLMRNRRSDATDRRGWRACLLMQDDRYES
jgi:hypothetical protein